MQKKKAYFFPDCENPALQPKLLHHDLIASLGILVFSATQGTLAK